MNRRSFLKAAAAAPIAAPLAAENMAAGGMMKALLSGGAAAFVGNDFRDKYGAACVPVSQSADHWGDQIKKVRKLFGLGIPDWLKRQHRQQAERTWIYRAPDVLALRSVSDIAKREIAIRRTEQKLVAEMTETPLFEKAREDFCKVHGWGW